MRRGVVVASICAGVIAGVSAWSWHRREQQKADPFGLYYRLTVDLSDKQGRPIGIDIVVGCGVHRGRIIGGGSTFDVMAMDAAFYAWAIPDGHALSVRTSPAIAATDTCAGGTTDNGRIAQDWLPFVIWYEDASDLSHGLAYATQDAYVSPRARIVFHGARITRATAEEYLAFKRRGLVNLIPPYLSDALLNSARPQRMTAASDVKPDMMSDPKKAWRNSDWLTCRGVTRVPLPPDVRAELAKLRPPATAKYWHLEGNLTAALSAKIRSKSVTEGGGFIRPETPKWKDERPKVYPMSYDGNLNQLTKATFADGSYHKEVRIGSENLGFMDCGRKSLEPLEAAVTGRQMQSWNISQETCFIDGIMVGKHKGCFIYMPLAFEDTDYVIYPQQLVD